MPLKHWYQYQTSVIKCDYMPIFCCITWSDGGIHVNASWAMRVHGMSLIQDVLTPNGVVLTSSDSHEPTRKRSREYTRRVAHQTVYDRTWLLARLCREKSLHITLDNKRESNLLIGVKTCGTNKTKKRPEILTSAAYLLSSAAMTCKHAVVGLTSSMDEAGVGLCGPVMGFGLQTGVAAGGGELGWGQAEAEGRLGVKGEDGCVEC